MSSRPFKCCLLVALLLLAGCDMLGIESAQLVAERKEADGKAVGAACRHAGRALEDCYGLNRRADKAAVFAGWREMNDYMRENSIDAVLPQLTTTAQVATKPPGADPGEAKAAAETPPRPAAKPGKNAS
jgi:hypothetical protein